MKTVHYLEQLNNEGKLISALQNIGFWQENEKALIEICSSEHENGFAIITKKHNHYFKLVLNDFEIISLTDDNNNKEEVDVYKIGKFYKFMGTSFDDYDENFDNYMNEQRQFLNKMKELKEKTEKNSVNISEKVASYIEKTKKDRNYQFRVMEEIDKFVKFANKQSVAFRNKFVNDIITLAIGTSFPDFIHQYAMHAKNLTDKSYVALTKAICENEFCYGDIKYHYCLDLPDLCPSCKRILTEAFIKDYYKGTDAGKIYIQYFYKFCKNLPDDCLEELRKYIPRDWTREV